MELDPNHSTTETEPSHPGRRSYWVMRLVRTTIVYGGYLTPRLYAPKEVWTQVTFVFGVVVFCCGCQYASRPMRCTRSAVYSMLDYSLNEIALSEEVVLGSSPCTCPIRNSEQNVYERRRR